MFKRLSILLAVCLSLSAQALEIDEKLTLRIVKVSESRKTILINRGIEDGLIKGDHAKFFLSVGVVARGVVVKVAPTRSVWSIYRLVNTDYIKNGQVMKLKITPAVKITKDDSKSLVADDSVSKVGMDTDPRNLGIPLAEGADDMTDLDINEAKSELGSQDSIALMEASSLSGKTREIFGSLHYSGMTGSTAPSNDSSSFSGATSLMVLNFGGEFYGKDEKSWTSRFSLVGLLSMTNTKVLAHEGSTVTENTTEYGGGIHWYPLTKNTRTYKLVPYFSLLFLMGSTSTSTEPGEAGGDGQKLSGSTVAYNLGVGWKYYLHNGLGARFEFDYYTRGDSFAEDPNGTNWVMRRAGPRISFGLSYRW